jgi:O-succinylbenzoic acid--CoA ligase
MAWREVEAGPWPALPARPDGWFCSLVPTQLERLLRLPGAVAWLRGFRGVFVGGGPSWPGLLERAAEAHLPLLLSYGMTETAAMVAAQRPGDFAAGDRTCGTALPHARLEIGADGAVVIRADSLWRGYYPDWREPGPLATPDLGALDAAGRLTLRGRGDGVVISGGEKIQPEEVEAALRATGQFADVAVVGVPDAEWGSRLVALYPQEGAPDLVVVAEALGGRLARHKHPKAFVAVADWPRNAQGKLNRARLAELASAAR